MELSQARETAPGLQITHNDGSPAEWNAYVARHPQATFFHQHEWLKLVQDVYGGTPYYLTAHQTGRVVGVLPLMQRRVIGPGNILISVPFADEGGLLADGPEAQAALIEAAREVGEKVGAGYVELRQVHPVGEGSLEDLTRVTLQLPLPNDADTLWRSFPAKVRNQVRKAERHGLTANVADELDRGIASSFYPVYSHNTRDLGSPMHAARFFQRLAGLLPQVFVVQVALRGKPIGAAIAVTHNGTFSVPWAGALRSHFSMCPNNLLYWKLMQLAIEQGCRTFDFGRSARDSGTYRFKLQWGAEEAPLHYCFLPISAAPHLGEKRDGRAYQIFSRVWQKTPLSIARTIGPKIFSRLPI